MRGKLVCVTLIVLIASAFAKQRNTYDDQRGCWTCSPGYVHWWDAGLPQPTDRCACVPASSAPTTTAPAPSPVSYDTRGCWTCSPGYTHWFQAGLASAPGGDRCACVPTSSGNTPSTPTTTKAPATSSPTSYDTRGCWTCSPGYTHWFQAGLSSAPGGDRCACVPTSSGGTPSTPSTAAPTTATPTTSAPSPTGYDTRGCWTCSPGYTHWFNAGLSSAPGGDRCACVPSSSGGTPSSPSSAPTSPTSAPSAGSSYTGLTGAMKYFIDLMTPNSNTPGSVSFSPGVSPYSPWNPPPLSVVDTLLNNLVTQTKFRTIMMYFIDYYTLNLVKARGLKVLAIVDLTTGDNNAVIENAITQAKAFPDTIVALSCGNELGANNGMTDRVVQVVNECVSRLRAGGVPQPIGSIDVFSVWCGGRESPCNNRWTAVSNGLDWMGLNDYPWWNNVFSGNWPCNTADQAAARTLDHYRVIQTLYGKPLVMTEFGWPTAAPGSSIQSTANYITGQQCGIANDANQKLMLQQTIDLFRANRLPCNTFQSFREDWKGNSITDINRWWGFCQGEPPYNCINTPH